MASPTLSLSQEEFNVFHAIDRKLYTLLVTDLWRDPLESMQTMALWLWLERAGFNNVIKRILSLPHILINELADEAVTCLNCINNTKFLLSSAEPGENIPLTHTLMKKEISLQFFHEKRQTAKHGVTKVVADVCIRAFADIMEQAIGRNAAERQMVMPPGVHHSLVHDLAYLGLGGGGDHNMGTRGGGRTQGNEVPADDRTMFVTFSKGYPVAEWEVREFFNGIFGECIESFYMQEVRPDQDQSLFARIVFHSTSFIELILDGMTKAKFTINGKHVWMRKFVPKRSSSSTPPRNLPGAV